MAFVNAWMLVIGGGTIAIPIVLHLIMQRKPQHLVFPALQFVKQRRATNQRRLQLRHWLLLALRCFVILLLAAALSKPSVASNLTGAWMSIAALSGFALLVTVILLYAIFWIQPVNRLLIGILSGIAVVVLLVDAILLVRTLISGKDVVVGDKQAPVAAVLILDTSPRMEYRQENQTRLEKSKELAVWLVNHLPPDSRIAITDATSGTPYFSVDFNAAKKRISTLDTTFLSETLPDRILSSIKFLNEGSDVGDLQREIYIFTDMTEPSWEDSTRTELTQALGQAPEIAIYAIDVHADNPTNFSLGNLRLDSDSITSTGELRVDTELFATGRGGSRTINLLVEKPDPGRPVRRDGKTLLPDRFWTRSLSVGVDSDDRAAIQFQLPAFAPGIHHGRIEIEGQDGLQHDDQRFFTFEVRPQWRLLVVHPKNVSPTNFVEAISPHTFRETGTARFVCETVLQSETSTRSLEDFDAVMLVDPEPLTEAMWQLLYEYTELGGGVAFFLGHNASNGDQPDKSFTSSIARRLMPGQLTDVWRNPAGDLFVSPQDFNHPIMSPFRKLATTVPWTRFPVYRHWGMRQWPDQDDRSVQIVLTYGNRMPMIVERSIGAGRVIAMTTPISDPSRPEGRKRWNDLPLGDDCWPYFIIVNELATHLVEERATKLNYFVGQISQLAIDPESDPLRFTMFSPRDEEPSAVRTEEGQLRYRFTDAPGNYRLRGNVADRLVQTGFSVNNPVETSNLQRIDVDSLNQLFGPDRLQIANNVQEIERRQGKVRLGQEFYPLLISLLAAALALEYILSNRFYKEAS